MGEGGTSQNGGRAPVSVLSAGWRLDQLRSEQHGAGFQGSSGRTQENSGPLRSFVTCSPGLQQIYI